MAKQTASPIGTPRGNKPSDRLPNKPAPKDMGSHKRPVVAGKGVDMRQHMGGGSNGPICPNG